MSLEHSVDKRLGEGGGSGTEVDGDEDRKVIRVVPPFRAIASWRTMWPRKLRPRIKPCCAGCNGPEAC
eukprot:1725216-Pyramimonas_sp.AAC.1